MQCEVCGAPLRGSAALVEIDGATFRACGSCATLGSPVRVRKPLRSVLKAKPTRPLMKEPLLELRDDYHKVIRQGRDKLGLSQEDLGRRISEKPSVIRLLESQKLKPDDLLVRKIEHVLRVKLLLPPEVDETPSFE